MFGFIRRLFGGAATVAGEQLPGGVSTITVQQYDGSSGPSQAGLSAQDFAGATLMTAQVTVETDPAPGGPSNVVRGAFPEGDYTVEAVLPARADEAGLALFGPHPTVRLTALISETTPPPLHGWTVLLIHGGSAGRPTDGSIRMEESDLAQLLALLPEDPGQVLVRLIRSTTDDDDWRSRDTSTDDWTSTAPDSPFESGTSAGTTGDQAVATALTDLGYTVLPEPGVPATDTAAAADAPGPSDPGVDTDWTPAGGAYGS